jgi:hypothetical protein
LHALDAIVDLGGVKKIIAIESYFLISHKLLSPTITVPLMEDQSGTKGDLKPRTKIGF